MLLTMATACAAVVVVDAEGARRAGVAILPSPGKGLGAFAVRHISAGEVVGDYVGEIMDGRAKDARYLGKGLRTAEDDLWLASRRERGVAQSGDYILGVGNDLYVDAEDPAFANWCRYLNHDDRPNVALKTLPRSMDGRPRAWFVALRDCAPGDELCFDYGDDYWFDAEPLCSGDVAAAVAADSAEPASVHHEHADLAESEHG